jgi:hypothetical protein
MFKTVRQWMLVQRARKEQQERERQCKENGHLPAFSQLSELYWFGFPCSCVRCGERVECPETPRSQGR